MEKIVIINANMGKLLHKLFKAIVNKVSESLSIMGESGSEASYWIPEPKKISEVARLSEDIKKPWWEENMKYINNLINNKNF